VISEEPGYGLSLEPDRTSRHSLGIHASPAEVYRALTDPEELVCWFVSAASVDVQPGGAFRWVFGRGSGDPGPAPLVTTGIFLAVAKQESLKMRALIEDLETEVEFRIDPWRDGAVLTVAHSGFPGDDEWDDTFRALDRGWQTELHVLKIFLERARGMRRCAERHERRLKAAPEALFDAFTTQAGLAAWLADRAAIDATPGGEFLLEWDAHPPLRGHLAACDPDRFLLLAWEGERPSLVRVHLEADGNGAAAPVDLTLDHILFTPEGSPTQRFDWDAALRRLEKAL
jgi:uncharacterized protein YndB with AHSA1/START domain